MKNLSPVIYSSVDGLKLEEREQTLATQQADSQINKQFQDYNEGDNKCCSPVSSWSWLLQRKAMSRKWSLS